MDSFRRLTDLPIEYCGDVRGALDGADFAVVQTSWQEIRDVSAGDFRKYLKSPIVFDGRRTYDPEVMISGGVRYYGVGWKNEV